MMHELSALQEDGVSDLHLFTAFRSLLELNLWVHFPTSSDGASTTSIVKKMLSITGTGEHPDL
jgi:hypothetical protein